MIKSTTYKVISLNLYIYYRLLNIKTQLPTLRFVVPENYEQ